MRKAAAPSDVTRSQYMFRQSGTTDRKWVILQIQEAVAERDKGGEGAGGGGGGGGRGVSEGTSRKEAEREREREEYEEKRREVRKETYCA